MNLAEMSDDELMKMAAMPADNLARQKKRGAGVDKFADPKNLADDELFAAAGIGPQKEAPTPNQARADALTQPKPGYVVEPMDAPRRPAADEITPDELYALGSSPQTLRARLDSQNHEGSKAGAPRGEFGQIVDRWKRPIGQQIREIPQDLDRASGIVARGLDAATMGYYSKARDWLAPGLAGSFQAADRDVAKNMPFSSNLAAGAGYLAPMGAPGILGRGAAAVGEAVGSVIPRMLARPVAGAVTGALGAGAVGAGEAAVAGEDPSQILDAGLRGAKYGGIVGGGVGAIQGGLGRLAEKADAKISERNLSDFTEGASAAKRDRVVGKGGVKYDRIDSLARRTPELEEAAGDPVKQAPIVQAQIDRTGSQLDQIYDGMHVRPDTLTRSMLEVAAEIRARPNTSQDAAIADALEKEAQHIKGTWSNYSTKGRPEGMVQPESAADTTSVGIAPREPTRMVSHESMRDLGYGQPTDNLGRAGVSAPAAEQGYIDARAARQMITNYGKGLFNGNPNNQVTIPKAIRQEVYRRQTDALRDVAEYFKPGVSEELNGANKEMSDWLNINDAVQARASRAATPSMTAKSILGKGLDMALGVMHPTHYLAKKGIEEFGPGAVRGVTNELSTMGHGSALLQEANPLINALENERAQSRRRADSIRLANESAAEFKKRMDDEEAQRRMLEAFQNSQPQN